MSFGTDIFSLWINFLVHCFCCIDVHKQSGHLRDSALDDQTKDLVGLLVEYLGIAWNLSKFIDNWTELCELKGIDFHKLRITDIR